MELHIEFAGENAAQVENPVGESVRVLKEIIGLIENEESGGLIYDLNGNRTGQWYIDVGPQQDIDSAGGYTISGE